MPKIDRILSLEITPEQFLNSCSLTELYEIELLIDSCIKRKENCVSGKLINEINTQINEKETTAKAK